MKRKLRSLFTLLVAVLSSVSGYAYEPLVQEGLIWNKSMLEFEDNGKPYEVVKQQYFGKSVEMHGRMYHPLMYDNNVCGYMRQDGDKVYLLVDGEYIPPYNEKLSVGDEVIVYDFAAKTGDKYMSVSLCGDGDLYPNPELVEIFVTKVDTVMVNGHERKRQYLSPHGDSFSSYYIAVEGVGINHGYVHLPQYVLYDGPSWRVSNINFDSMTDAEGNVLFTGADFDTRAYQPMVQEGKVWCGLVDFAGTGLDRRNAWKPEMYFEGKYVCNGKEYTALRTSPDNILALMRQEGGKVYLLLDDHILDKYQVDYKSSSDPGELKNTEVLVYDFDLTEGDWYRGAYYIWMNNSIWINIMPLKVLSVDEISVNGQTLRRINVRSIGKIVEGYGAEKGECLIPQVVGGTAGMHDYYDPELKMHHIIDRATREEIFSYEDFSKPSVGVEEIPAEQPSDGAQAKPKDNKMYDLNGREIRNPLPGTVYIQNGEKHVAK